MKYFFLSYADHDSDTHMIAARSIDSARDLAELSGKDIKDLYELKEDTFKEEGFVF